MGQFLRAELQQSGVILTSLPACSHQSCRGKPSLYFFACWENASSFMVLPSKSNRGVLAPLACSGKACTSFWYFSLLASWFKWRSCFQNSCKTKGGQCWLRCEPTAKGLLEHQMLSAMCSNRPDAKLHKMGALRKNRLSAWHSFSKAAAQKSICWYPPLYSGSLEWITYENIENAISHFCS